MAEMSGKLFFERAVTVHRYDCEVIASPPSDVETDSRVSASVSPRVASGSNRCVGSRALSKSPNETRTPSRSYSTPVEWCITLTSSP